MAPRSSNSGFPDDDADNPLDFRNSSQKPESKPTEPTPEPEPAQESEEEDLFDLADFEEITEPEAPEMFVEMPSDELPEEIEEVFTFDELFLDEPEIPTIPESIVAGPPSDTPVLKMPTANDPDSEEYDFSALLGTESGGSIVSKRNPESSGSAINLGDVPSKAGLPLSDVGDPPSGGSSILGNPPSSVVPSAPGSGWFDPPEAVQPPEVVELNDEELLLFDEEPQPNEAIAGPASGWDESAMELPKDPAIPTDAADSGVIAELYDLPEPAAPGSGWLEQQQSVDMPIPDETPEAQAAEDLVVPLFDLEDETSEIVAGPASGWDESVIDVPVDVAPKDAADSGIVADLFDLDDESTTAAGSGWLDQQQSMNMPIPVEPTKENVEELTSSLWGADEDDDSTMVTPQLAGEPAAGDGESGINLLSDEMLSIPKDGESRSSIFGNSATEEASRIDLEALPEMEPDADVTEAITFDLKDTEGVDEADSSIFDKTLRVPSLADEDDSAIDMPIVAQDDEDPDQKHGLVEWTIPPNEEDIVEPNQHAAPTDFEALAAAELAEADTTQAFGGSEPDFGAFADEVDEDATEGFSSSRAPRRSQSFGDVELDIDDDDDADEPATPVRAFADDMNDDGNDDDEPAAVAVSKKEERKAKPTREKKPKDSSGKKGGAGAWVGGGVLGLLIGGGAMAGAYFGDLLPSNDAGTKPVAVAPNTNNNPPQAVPIDAAELEKLKKERDETLANAQLREKELLAQVILEKEKLTTIAKEQETALLAAAKAKTDLTDAETKLKDALTAEADAKKAQLLAEASIKDLTKTAIDSDKALKDAMLIADDAKKLAVSRTKDLAEAELKMLDTQKQLKAADDSLAGIVKELKANKLLDEKDDGPMALAKLPAVIKQVANTATSADAKKAAEALNLAQKQIETLQADMKKSEGDIAKARDMAKLAQDDAAKAKLDAEALAKKALETAKADAMKEVEKQILALQKKIDDSTADTKKAMADAAVVVKQAQAETAIKLAAADMAKAIEKQKMLESHKAELDLLSTQIATLRSGGKVAITSQEVLKEDRAIDSYASGLRAFFERRYTDAIKQLTKATQDNPNDARYWYFLGLSAQELGNTADAEVAFKKGAALEAKYLPSTREIANSLERVQGPARRELNKYRP